MVGQGPLIEPPVAEDVGRRRAGRVLLVHEGAVLLLHGRDPHRPEAGSWWFTVGGGCEDGESTGDAARREAYEEVGVPLPAHLGPVVLHRTAEFDFEGVRHIQTEDFYCCAVASRAVATDGWTDLERRSIEGYRWWRVAELRATGDAVYPEQLADLLAGLLPG